MLPGKLSSQMGTSTSSANFMFTRQCSRRYLVWVSQPHVLEAWARSLAGGTACAAVHSPGDAGGGGAPRLEAWGVNAGAASSSLVNIIQMFPVLQIHVICVVAC